MPRRLLMVLLPLLVAWTAVDAADSVSIYDVQYTLDPGGDSPYNGQAVTVTGAVSAVFLDGYTVADSSGPWRSVFVRSIRDGPDIGDEVAVTGTVRENFGMTEIYSITEYDFLSPDNVILPCSVEAQDIPQEMYESVLLRVADVTVTEVVRTTREWTITDTTGGIACDVLNDYMYFPQVGDSLASVTGILFYSNSEFKIEPRQTSDISGEVIPHYALGGDIVTMNLALDIHEDAYVEIQGDLILAIVPSPPSGIPVVETGGLIFPGLIDGHNHAWYNVLDHIPFGQTFEERSQWQATTIYSDFGDQISGMAAYGSDIDHYKLAEVRALCAGTTMMQSANCNDWDDRSWAHQGMGIGNVERFPARVYDSVFPLRKDQSSWITRQENYWERFVIHLSEGTNDSALAEFYTWVDWGMLDWRTTILHGVPYGPDEWDMMAVAGAHLVWSPKSDWVLYEASPNIPEALAAGVNVAIAPDWTESGAPNMLAEIRFGDELNDSLWGGVLSPLDFALFATRNAALSMGAEDRVGQIAPGMRADLMVIPGSPLEPYQALLDADQGDVWLTVVSGRPMYGDSDLMAQFPFLSDMEEFMVCGSPKLLAVSLVAKGIPQSEKLTSEVLYDVRQAYDNTVPQVCAFLGAFDCEISGTTPTARLVLPGLSLGPNPLTTESAISFSLPTGSFTSLGIYSVCGKALRTLVDCHMDQGSCSILWDGRDGKGRRVASGLYVIRLRSCGETRTAKVVVTR